MNKLMGFYELNDLDIPTVPWREYTGGETLDPHILWTVRSAVYRGGDLNLPRKVGVPAQEAARFAEELRGALGQNGIVIYYPYFLANKSGTLEVRRDKAVVEAVKADLWNLVSLSEREVTVEHQDGAARFFGNRDFLSQEELAALLAHVPKVRRAFRDQLAEGRSLLLEWSLAQKSSFERTPVGEEYLVFYELRTV